MFGKQPIIPSLCYLSQVFSAKICMMENSAAHAMLQNVALNSIFLEGNSKLLGGS